MRADGRGTDHVQIEFAAPLACLEIKVVQNLDMIGQKADRQDDDVARRP